MEVEGRGEMRKRREEKGREREERGGRGKGREEGGGGKGRGWEGGLITKTVIAICAASRTKTI